MRWATPNAAVKSGRLRRILNLPLRCVSSTSVLKGWAEVSVA
jgi:hypothetical protein